MYIFLLIVLLLIDNSRSEFNIKGTIKPGWEPIYNLFEENFIYDRDLGASISIYHRGKPVIELNGGWFDRQHTKPYDDRTLQLVFSTTKGIVATSAALAVQRNLLDYSSPVTKYWPRYGQKGKQNTTVKDILGHRAGLPNVTIPAELFTNWTDIIRILEEHQPDWIPGEAHSYHPLTYGWLAAELVRRVDPRKRSFGQFVYEEIALPLDLEFYIGLPEQEQNRVSSLELNEATNRLNNSFIEESMHLYNQPSLHRAEVPGANGISNARSIAKLYASLIGEISNSKIKRLLHEHTLKQATTTTTPEGELDLVSQTSIPFGMGYMLFDKMFPELGPGSFGHFGS